MNTYPKKPAYDDIIDFEHHVSATRPRMSRAERAAQFSPFAALTGYSTAIKETARLTDERAEHSESELTQLNDSIHMLIERIDNHPQVKITYFKPDELKKGGSYLTAHSRVKKINEYERFVLLEDGMKIPFDDIYKIEFCI